MDAVRAPAVATPSTAAILDTSLALLDLRHDPEFGLLWSVMQPRLRPGHGAPLVADLIRLHTGLADLFAAADAGQPFRHLVTRSAVPGIFNLGLDPGQLAADVRAQKRGALAIQIHAAALRHHAAARAYGVPIVTIALVEGDALGLGFEHALAHDILIAEPGALFGFPETTVGLFPAAGAASFLIRRIGHLAAERLLLSGALHSGEELHRLGVVDVLAEDGGGEAALRDFVRQHERRFTMQRAVYAARRRVHPVAAAELQSLGDLWVDTALRMAPTQLAMLDRLADAEAARLAPLRAV